MGRYLNREKVQARAEDINNRLLYRGVIQEPLSFNSLAEEDDHDNKYARDDTILRTFSSLLERLDRRDRETTKFTEELRRQAAEIDALKQENSVLEKKITETSRKLSEDTIDATKVRATLEKSKIKEKEASEEIRWLKKRNKDISERYTVERRKHAREMEETRLRFNPLKRVKLSAGVSVSGNLVATPGVRVELAVDQERHSVAAAEISDLKEIIGNLLLENYHYEHFCTSLSKYLASIPAVASQRTIDDPQERIKINPEEIDLQVHLTAMKRFDLVYPVVMQRLENIRQYLNRRLSTAKIRDLEAKLKETTKSFENSLKTMETWKNSQKRWQEEQKKSVSPSKLHHALL